MIKFIASDLDGTLLLPDGSLPEETFPLIEKLYEKNVYFCPASGRQYASLKKLFAPVADKIFFIAENGALVYHKDELLYRDCIPPERIPDILSVVRKIPDAHPLLCCADYAYAADDDAAFAAECAKYYPHFRRVSDLCSVAGDPACKVAVYDPQGSARSGKLLAQNLPDYRAIVSGKVWSDVSMPGTNKGKALKFIQSHLALSEDECMAFGDYMNDLELLEACTHAYVPENGCEELKEKIGGRISSNAEKGVLKKIKENIDL